MFNGDQAVPVSYLLTKPDQISGSECSGAFLSLATRGGFLGRGGKSLALRQVSSSISYVVVFSSHVKHALRRLSPGGWSAFSSLTSRVSSTCVALPQMTHLMGTPL